VEQGGGEDGEGDGEAQDAASGRGRRIAAGRKLAGWGESAERPFLPKELLKYNVLRYIT
jgi:hypothetical protein